MLRELDAYQSNKIEVLLKLALLKLAVPADVVLDLHCDSTSVFHMYTHDQLWPEMADLAADMGSFCHLLAPAAGGNPFDEGTLTLQHYSQY